MYYSPKPTSACISRPRKTGLQRSAGANSVSLVESNRAIEAHRKDGNSMRRGFCLIGILALMSGLMGGVHAQSPSTIPGIYAWWDATSSAGVADANGNANVTKADHIIDQTGGTNHLYCKTYSGAAAGSFPEVSRVDRALGGLSEVLLAYQDHRSEAGQELDGPSVDLGSSKAWTFWMTWTRPRWKYSGGSYPQENSTVSTSLIRCGSTDLLTLPGGDPSQLAMFNSTLPVPGSITERHTHSIIIRNTPGTGVAVWLDNVRVVTAGVNFYSASQLGKLVFLRDGGLYFHDGGVWQRAITDTEIGSLQNYLSRYYFGSRLAFGQLSMGQSNQGQEVSTYSEAGNRVSVPAYLNGYVITASYGAVSANGVGTIFGGNSLYATGSGTFLKDPGDGSDPSTWSLGGAGNGCLAYFATLLPTDKQYLNFVHWLQGENDTTLSASTQPKYESACKRFMDLIRSSLGRTATQLPWIVPLLQPYGYGNDTGHNLVRRSWTDIANIPGNPYNVYIASRANGDTDINYGVSTYGDAHMDDLDCKQMAVRDGLVIAMIYQNMGYVDGLNLLAPTVGPSISTAQKINATTVRITVQQDQGTDLTVPTNAAGGLGWRVHDGATTIGVTACQRTSPTTLQLTLAAPITGTSPTVVYAEGYGRLATSTSKSGRGNAIYDNATVPADLPSATALSPGPVDATGATVLPMPLGLSVYPTPITQLAAALDVSSSVSVTPGGFSYRRNTGHYFQQVTLTNIGSSTITGPLSLVIDNLAGATLASPGGLTQFAAPVSSPYVSASAVDLAPGATVSVVLDFTAQPSGYTTRILAGTGSR